MFQSKKTVYHIDRIVRETGEVLDNGLQEIYVNTKINDGSDIAELMRIFTEVNAYDFEKFPKVSNRKRQFKVNEGGNGEVCDLVENYARSCAERAAKEATDKAIKDAIESAKKLFQNGVGYEVVQTSISTLSDEVLQGVYAEVKGV